MAKDKLICKYKASDELAKLQCNLKVGNVHVIVVKEVNLLEKVNRKEDAEEAKTVFAVPYRCHCQSERGNIVELIVSEDKMFMLRYRKTTETLNITSYYGVWNKHLVPQHL